MGELLFRQLPHRIDDGLPVRLAWQALRFYCRALHRFTWSAPDPLPRHGPVILASNHRSSVDPFILLACTRRVLSFLIAREFYRIPVASHLFEWMGCIAVRRDSRDIGSIRQSLAALNRGHALCLFPEGGIDRGARAARHGTAYLAWHSRAPVIPAGISGTPRSPSVWKSLCLPSRSRIRFGRPMPPAPDPTDRNNRAAVEQWTRQLMQTIDDLHTSPV